MTDNSKIDEAIEIMESYKDETTCGCDRCNAFIMSTAALKTMRDLDTLIKDRYLTKDKLQHQLGWCEGHKKAIEEVKAKFQSYLTEER